MCSSVLAAPYRSHSTKHLKWTPLTFVEYDNGLTLDNRNLLNKTQVRPIFGKVFIFIQIIILRTKLQ